MSENYTTMPDAYDNELKRGGVFEMETQPTAMGGGGKVEQVPVKNDGAMDDVWIKNYIRSVNWKSKTSGFYIDGQTGYAEFSLLTGPTIILNQSSTGGGVSTTGYLRWSGGNRIWSDLDNNMGINALSGFIWFYGNSNQIAAFLENDQSIFYNGISCQGNLNVGSVAARYNARISGYFALGYFTNAQRAALTPTNGMMIYNTDTGKIEAYVGSAWVTLSYT